MEIVSYALIIDVRLEDVIVLLGFLMRVNILKSRSRNN